MQRFKVIVSLILIIFLLMPQLVSASVVIMKLQLENETIDYEAEEVKIFIDGVEIKTKEMPPIIIKERTLVPAREVFENLGALVEWVQETREVYVTLGARQVKLAINSDIAYVTKHTVTDKYTLDVPATIINEKTMIPIRFVAESFDCIVKWDNDTRVINIETNQNIDESLSDSSLEDNEYEDENANKETNSENNVENEEIEEEKVPEGTDGVENVDIDKTKFVWVMEDNKKDDEKYLGFEDININRVKYSTTNITDIKTDIDEKEANISIIASSKITGVDVTNWDEKIVIDIENSINKLDSNISCDENIFSSGIRTSQFTKDSTRVVIDLLDSKNYYVELSENRKEINIKIYKNEIYKIELTEKRNVSTFEIYSFGKINYDSFRMTNDDRIIVDILGSTSSLGYKTAKIENSDNILQIRTSPFEENVTRFVFDTNGQKNYEVIKEDDDKIIVKITDLDYDNLTYYNFDSYEILIENEDNIKFDIDDVEINEDYINKIYEIILPDEFEDLIGEGDLLVEDSRVQDIKINEKDDETIITINANSVIALKVEKVKSTKNDSKNNLLIKLLRPGEKYDKVVVLDPGHGGEDPGATVKKYMEKDYNLDIALQVEDYLNDNTDIKVYMTRKDDSYPSLRERPELANEILADLYISIHNNAMDKTTWNGTEVLYNDTVSYFDGTKEKSGLNNKKLATIFAEEITERLDRKFKNNGTKERNGTDIKDGISKRTDLAVLKLAKMPAVLIELAFMTNANDLSKLNDPKFITKASENIAEIIEEVLEDYN